MTDSPSNNFLSPLTGALASVYRRVLRLLGRPAVEQTEPIRLRTDLCLAQQARLSRRFAELALPESLLTAFSTKALAAGDARFIVREQPSTQILAALESFRAGRSTMVAVTGPQGCGITSFLMQLAAQAGGEEYRYGKLTHRPCDISDSLALLGGIVGCESSVGSVDELLVYINALPPSLFLIDNGHYLTCRVMGANEAIRVFGAVMVATQQRHLWVLGCEEYAWRRLTYIYRAERYFTDRIELRHFNEAELGLCLSSRLQMSATTLDTEVTAEHQQATDVLARELPTLYKLSNGKPDLAFFYFLGSLLLSDGTGRLALQPAIPLDFGALKLLLSDELFTLAEVAAHGEMTIDEHRAIFRSSHEQSWLMLERLYHRCLLDKDESKTEAAYHLVPQYSDVICRYLSNANYLY